MSMKTEVKYTFTKKQWDEAFIDTTRFVAFDNYYFNKQNAQAALTAVELFKDLLLNPKDVPNSYIGFNNINPSSPRS